MAMTRLTSAQILCSTECVEDRLMWRPESACTRAHSARRRYKHGLIVAAASEHRVQATGRGMMNV